MHFFFVFLAMNHQHTVINHLKTSVAHNESNSVANSNLCFASYIKQRNAECLPLQHFSESHFM